MDSTPAGVFVPTILLIILVPSIWCNVILITNDMKRMLEFSSIPPYCRVHADRETIDYVYEARPNYVKLVSDDYFQDMVKKCREPVENAIERGLKFIYPGTNWCGPGNVAKNYSDLGIHEAEDSCCREHDNCPMALENGQCLNEICNDSTYTRSHCDCDATFQRCLQHANTETANTIGAIFFNVVKIICFREMDGCNLTEDEDMCQIEFVESAQYTAPKAPFHAKNVKAFFFNKLLRGLKLL